MLKTKLISINEINPNLNGKLILFSMNAVSHIATYNVVISVEYGIRPCVVQFGL